ncbi:MAG: PAS domain S-box protein [Oscillochloris sp.]|nr:PAS domain S-box protein [Oscillochloris sp.]
MKHAAALPRDIIHQDDGGTLALLPLLTQAFGLMLILLAGIAAVSSLPQQALASLAIYASWHTILEIGSVVSATLIFVSGWVRTGHPQLRSNVILACAFLAVGLIDLLHLLAYAGMPPLVTPSGSEKAINFWLAARLISAVALLHFILFPAIKPATERFRYLALGCGLTTVGLVAWLGLWQSEWLPRTFIPGSGLTPLKITVEYLIAGLYLSGAVVLVIRRRLPSSVGVRNLVAALLIMAASELCFTLYQHVTDGFNLLGHGYKIAADLFLYQAIFISTVREPYRRLAQAYAQLTKKQAALQASEARFHALHTAIEELIFTLDREGRHTDVYGRWLEKTGLTPAQFLGRSAREILGPEAAAVHDEANARALAGEPVLYNWTVDAPDGKHYYQTSLAPLRDQNGQISGVIGLGRDLTAQYTAENSLRERDEQLRLAHDATQLGTWKHEIATNILSFDEQAQTHLGIQIPTMTLSEFTTLVHADDRDRVVQTISETLGPDSQGRREIEYRVIHQDKSVHWLAVHVRIYFSGEGATRRPVLTAGTTQDVTERRQAEADLRDAADALQHLSRRLVEAHERERRHIARELHDEVGQVLTGLKLTLNVAADRAPADLATTLADAQTAINELMGRVRGLSLDLRPALLDDMGLIPALGWYLDRFTPRTGVRVELRHQGATRRFAAEIETAAYRIIQEALTNVARHSGVQSARVRILADNERLMVRIDDDGRGFEADIALNNGSTGGLSGMHERVQLIGGILTIESAPASGTHVIAELPLPLKEG